MQSMFDSLSILSATRAIAQSLSIAAAIMAVVATGCTQPLLRVVPNQDCNLMQKTCVSEIPCEPTVRSQNESCEVTCYDRLPLRDRIPLGHTLGSFSAKASDCWHDNFIARAIRDHQAEKLAAKNAPPWPSFHPIPTEPVFFATDVSSELENGMSDGSVGEHSPDVTPNYGQFSAAKKR